MFESFLANKFAAAKRFGLEVLLPPLPVYLGCRIVGYNIVRCVIGPGTPVQSFSKRNPCWRILVEQGNNMSTCTLQGCESLVPGMKALIDRSTELGVDSIVMGMPHRGELRHMAVDLPQVLLMQVALCLFLAYVTQAPHAHHTGALVLLPGSVAPTGRDSPA